ncbi:MAG TPA: hypothetical protein VMU66_04930 [Gaiellales bacterium]|nr:hypothetical protein [Gaiellales bacterium]
MNGATTPFAEIAAVFQAVRSATARTDKIELLAAALRRIAPAELPAAVGFLSGELRQRQVGAGWAALRGCGRQPCSPP